ncbi:MAG: type II toxin-antitoxin system HicA family toxin [Candidatus Paceibacterota bacterium]|jgi:predicted RNA binding protein YcfA (HicA-like mRNA interferase family)
MPKGFYNWTAEDIIRLLKAYGFNLNHTRGSHYYYVARVSGSFRQVCVPFHGSRAIKPRTLKAIIRQSGIPKERWMEGQ